MAYRRYISSVGWTGDHMPHGWEQPGRVRIRPAALCRMSPPLSFPPLSCQSSLYLAKKIYLEKKMCWHTVLKRKQTILVITHVNLGQLWHNLYIKLWSNKLFSIRPVHKNIMENYQSWIGFPRAWNSTLLKQSSWQRTEQKAVNIKEMLWVYFKKPGELVNIVKYSEMRSGLRLLDSFICVMCNNQCS